MYMRFLLTTSLIKRIRINVYEISSDYIVNTKYVLMYMRFLLTTSLIKRRINVYEISSDYIVNKKTY